MPLFTSIEDATSRLADTGYLVDQELATVVFLGDALGFLTATGQMCDEA